MFESPDNSYHPHTRQEWRSWLGKNYRRAEGVWVLNFKKDTGKPRLEYEDIVEEALCFGWIDSIPRKLDDERTMLWVSPRKNGSKWSSLNKKRIEKLTAAKLMHEAGVRKVEAAKRDGSWTALDDIEANLIPDDVTVALNTFPHAKENFVAFPKSVRRGILEWILNAKKPETRAKRILKTAAMAEKNQRANQWRT